MPEHPSVDRVVAALREAGVVGEPRWFDDGVRTAAEAAAALGVEVGAIANSLVFALDGEPILVMTSGSHRVDTVWLGAQLGGTITRADAQLVRSATGQVIGGVAPVGHPAPLRTWVDTQLADFDEIWAAAGHSHAVFPLAFDELVRITGGVPTRVAP
jgi:prolyl-tRNA editing enzyme YbaK/EbsC (Cys-tRNA(Pro) deacylase)